VREYELMTVFRPDLGDEGIQQASERLDGLISARGAEITNTDMWGQRRMAYPISDFRDGVYRLSKLQMDPSAAIELERTLRLNDQILRHMLIRLDED
jgi:small subunit ribosomal protein S6